MLFGVVYNYINCGGRLRTTPRRSLMRRVLFLLSKDTFNKTGYRQHYCRLDSYTLPVSEVIKHVYRI